MRYTSAISVKKKELSPKYMIFLKFRQKLELQMKELNQISSYNNFSKSSLFNFKICKNVLVDYLFRNCNLIEK